MAIIRAKDFLFLNTMTGNKREEGQSIKSPLIFVEFRIRFVFSQKRKKKSAHYSGVQEQCPLMHVKKYCMHVVVTCVLACVVLKYNSSP